MRLSFILLSFLIATVSIASIRVLPLAPNDKNVKDFPFVGSVANFDKESFGSGTVIEDGSFVLTAKHAILSKNPLKKITDPNFIFFEVNSKFIRVKKIYVNDSCDLAILELVEAVNCSVDIYSGPIFGEEFYGVGYGYSSSCPNFQKIDWDIPYGSKEVFKNIFTSIEFTATIFADKSVVIETNVVFSLHDPDTFGQPDGAIIGEGMQGPGDSGGGIFIVENGRPKLAAVIVALSVSNNPYKGFAVDISDYIEWVFSITDRKPFCKTDSNKIPSIYFEGILRDFCSLKRNKFSSFIEPE